jgi:hypothetical protein
MDHPKKPAGMDRKTALQINLSAFRRIWPALTAVYAPSQVT